MQKQKLDKVRESFSQPFRRSEAKEACHLAFSQCQREIFRFKTQSAETKGEGTSLLDGRRRVRDAISLRASSDDFFPSLPPSGDNHRSLTETKLEI